MGRFANSWKVFKQSLNVLKKDKELLFLPVLSGIASLVVVASFVFPAYFAGFFDQLANRVTPDQIDETVEYVALGLMFLMYLLLTFVTIYFTSGIMYAANMRLDGQDPRLGDALKGPSKQLGKIFLWSLFVATISLLLRAIEAALRDRFGNMAGMIFGFLAGAAWWMATYFAIPVVLFEGKHVGGALKRSTGLFRQRWGESLIGEFGLGIAIFLLNLVTLPIAVVGFYLIGVSFYLGVAVLILAGLYVIFINIMLAPALNAIYKTALYRYATKGEDVPYFTPDVIHDSWRVKGDKGQPTFTAR